MQSTSFIRYFDISGHSFFSFFLNGKDARMSGNF